MARNLDRYVTGICGHLSLPAPVARMRLYVFESQERLDAFVGRQVPKHSESQAVCFQKGMDYIVALRLTGDTDRSLALLRHELTHYVLASRFFDMPPWIDEGLAHYFEAGEPWGRIYPLDMKRLQPVLERDVPLLERLVWLPAGSPIGLEEYAQAWALTHYLMHSPRYGRDRVLRYLRVVRSGKWARLYFKDVFGVAPYRLEVPWREYIGELRREMESGAPPGEGPKGDGRISGLPRSEGP
jgi:hypothetical protein